MSHRIHKNDKASVSIEQLLPTVEERMQGRDVLAVDARLVWEWLEVETRFNDWIERRIQDYSFVVGTDYLYSNLSRGEKDYGPRPANEYSITMDMAKQLCMVERTERGRQARLYFIHCEDAYWRLREEEAIRKSFLLPDYDHDSDSLYPHELWVQICRVYGFAPPRGAQHSPGCRGIVSMYINGILPKKVQEELYDHTLNPYCQDGVTRKERHWRKLVPKCRLEVLVKRIHTVLDILCACEDNTRDMFKRAMYLHDLHNGIMLTVAPKVQMRLGQHSEQLFFQFG